MNLTWENSEKPNFGPDFCPFDPNLPPNFFSWVLLLLDVRHCHKLSSYAISKKTYDQKKEDGEKPHFRLDSKFWPSIFFFKNLAFWVTRYPGQLSSWTISGKTNDPLLRKFSDGWTDRRTERQTDGREWFYRTLSD